jgi:hypothetical protein
VTFMAENPATTVDGNTLRTTATRLREHLQRISKQGVPVIYNELSKALDLTRPNTIHQVTEALEHLMEEDAATGHPFIASIAISKARGGLPAPGFFDCARRLRRFSGDDVGPEAWAFHAQEFRAAILFWSSAPPTGKSG